MNWDSVGVYGAAIPDLTPNIDALAAEGLRFEQAHVTIAICQPTRAVWMTGRYPHRSGALGFEEIRADVPTLIEALRDAGYYTSLMAKHGHVLPSRPHTWDEIVPAKELENGRSPSLYYSRTLAFLRDADELTNVVDNPAYRDELARLRTRLNNWRVDTDDRMPDERRLDGFNLDGEPLPHNQPFYDNWLRQRQVPVAGRGRAHRGTRPRRRRANMQDSR